jgi:hypothetical protein
MAHIFLPIIFLRSYFAHMLTKMTPNQTLETENRAAAQRARRANLSPQQRAAAAAVDAERHRSSRANHSPQQRAAANAANAERHR